MSNLIVSASPHIRDKVTVKSIMLDVVIALCPAIITAIVVFGFRAALVVAVCVASCIFFEWGYEKIVKRPCTIKDMSAVVTGVLLALNLPVGIPIWQAIFGCLVAIVVVKQLFGGLGYNFANPAIAARIVLLISFSTAMTTWVFPDAVSTATPLALIQSGNVEALPSIGQMLLGARGGCLGETGVIALLIGGIYLIARRVITWHTPVCFIATVFVFTLILGENPVYQILSGGLFLGAFFMATDYVTTPYTKSGRAIFGFGCGIITVLIRVWGNYPEGVSFAILLMNILSPYITRWTSPKPLGGAK